MIATPQPPDPDAVFARTVMQMAAELDAVEAAIKREILSAAKSGDTDRVIDITERWLRLPALEVLGEST